MTAEQKARAVMALRVIAATAAKAADDLEKNRMWPGDLASAKRTIERQLPDIKDDHA